MSRGGVDVGRERRASTCDGRNTKDRASWKALAEVLHHQWKTLDVERRGAHSHAEPGNKENNAMFRISAFADEIDPDPQKQIDVLRQCGIRHLELRSILKTNVLDLTELQVQELKSLLDRHGFKLSAIGSPIGKI